MNCADCQGRLEEYALEALSRHDAEQVAAHLATGCPQCRSMLAEIETTWALLGESLQPVAPPAHLKSALFEQIRSGGLPTRQTRQADVVTLSEPDESPRLVGAGRRGPAVAACLAATLLGILAGVWYVSPSAEESRGLAFLEERLQALTQRYGDTADPAKIHVGSLTLAGGQRAVSGHLIVDNIAGQLHLYAFDLQPPAAGKSYQLWFVADGDRWLAGGRLAVKPDGVFTAVVDLPELAEGATRIVVTEEPDADEAPAAPQSRQHGPERLSGSLL